MIAPELLTAVGAFGACFCALSAQLWAQELRTERQLGQGWPCVGRIVLRLVLAAFFLALWIVGKFLEGATYG